MVGSQIGFISSLTSTAAPRWLLNLKALGGGRFQADAFNLGPGEQIWLKIPVVGRRVTAVNSAEININLNWQLWYEGRLFPKMGKITSSETTVIDPR